MPDTDTQKAIQAAQSLVMSLKDYPPQAHSVYVHTEVNKDTQEFERSIYVSIHPKFENKIKLPSGIGGFPIVRQPWPKEMR